jgi:hypothetical protein
MFLLNTILAWNINNIMSTKYDNNNIIIASRKYFLQSPTCTIVNNLVILAPITPMVFQCFSYTLHVVNLIYGSDIFRYVCICISFCVNMYYSSSNEMASYKLGLLVIPQFLGRNYVATIVIQ